MQLSAEADVTPPRFTQAVKGLRSGQALTWLCADDPVVRSALVESVIDAVADLDTRFVRAANPLRAPLTIERLLIQAIGPEADLRHSRDPAAMTRLLATQLGDETRVIVVVEQAETLDGESLEMLRAMEPHLENAEPRVQILLSAPHLPDVRPPETDAELVPLVCTPLLPPESAAPRRLLPFLLFGLLIVLGSVGIAIYLADSSVITRAKLYLPQRFRTVAAEPPSPVRALIALPQAQAAVPQPAAATPIMTQAPVIFPPAPASAAPQVEDAAAMRHEFDEFLARSGDSAPKLTDAQRSDLFDQFLAWRRSQSQAAAR